MTSLETCPCQKQLVMCLVFCIAEMRVHAEYLSIGGVSFICHDKGIDGCETNRFRSRTASMENQDEDEKENGYFSHEAFYEFINNAKIV